MPHEKSVSAIVSTEHGVFEIGDGDYMDNAEPMGILPTEENHEIVNAGKLPIDPMREGRGQIRRDVAPMSETMGSAHEPDLSDFYNPSLPRDLREVSIKFHDLALFMLERMPASAQRAQGLWDLLRAKDCAVRAWRYRNVRVGFTEDDSDGSST